MEIQWHAEEYEYKKKSPDWFWALWIISIAVIFVSIMLGSALFAILIFVGAFTLSLQAVRKPKLINFKVDELGIGIEDKLYPYKNILSYDIKDSEQEMILKLENKFMPFVIIPLAKNIDTQKLEGLLSDHLEKETLEKTVTDKLTKYL